MRIIFALGNPTDTGGPTAYALNVQRECERRGHHTRLISYPSWMWRLPSGLRHLAYACRLIPALWSADCLIAFDTMTVGIPALFATKVTHTPLLIRIGGDFIWEQYVERTGDLVKLSRFYTLNPQTLSSKERIERWLTGVVTRHASALLFNSQWQRALWQPVYKFSDVSVFNLENVYPPRRPSLPPEKPVFVAAGRPLRLKQEGLLTSIFVDLKKRYPSCELDLEALPSAEHRERVARCWAVILASVSDVAPNAIIDAVAAGKPFICTNDTGIKERLEGTGIFVDTQDTNALEAAIESLLDPKEYERIQKRIEAFSFTRTWEQLTDDVLTIMKTVCAS